MPTALPLDSILSISIDTETAFNRGSGVVLPSGLYALTVAHLFADYKQGDTVAITSANGLSYDFEQVYVHHDWRDTSTDFNFDIAVIKLTPPEPVEGVTIWSGGDYQHEVFTLAGITTEGELHTGTNVFDADGIAFNDTHGLTNIEGTQLLYDFDNGLDEQNSVSSYLGLPSSSTPTPNETLAQLGDSGGALLIDNQIAAISSYVFRSSSQDSNDSADSSAGEIGGATYIAPYIPWIDSILNGNPDYIAPQKSEDVLTNIAEPFSGEIINHFLLEMSQAQTQEVRLYYGTSAGTATADVDYKVAQGWVNISPGDTHIAIPITIYGDIEAEQDETFSLVVTDPTGQWIDEGVQLIATHTIIDNSLI